MVCNETSILSNEESIRLHNSLVTAVRFNLVCEEEDLISFEGVAFTNVWKGYFYKTVTVEGSIVDFKKL